MEVLARRAGSPVDPVIEILDAAGKPVPRATAPRSTAKTYTTFRDHDSAGPGIRLETWNELAIDDYLFVDGELVRILALPKGPDDDCQFYQVGGPAGRLPRHHADAPQPGQPDVQGRDSTRPAGPSRRTACRVSRSTTATTTAAPATARTRSCSSTRRPTASTRSAYPTPAAGGPTHAYRLTVRPPRPDFSVSFNPTAPSVWKGGRSPSA